jgi:hypothetical protein
MTTPLIKQPLVSYGMAKRRRRNGQSESRNIVMATVACDQCGAQFVITHRPAFEDASLAQRQVLWLKDRFVWDHIQEHKHAGSTMLPALPEAKASTLTGA